MTNPIQAINSDLEQSDINLMLVLTPDASAPEKDPKRALIAHAVLALSAAKTTDRLMTQGHGLKSHGSKGSFQGSKGSLQGSDEYYNAGSSKVINNGVPTFQYSSNGSGGGGIGSSDPNFPCPFDPNQVPSSAQGIIDEMRLWIHDMQAYGQNPSLLGPFVQWMVNVTNALPSLPPDGQALVQKMFAQVANLDCGTNGSLAEMIVNYVESSAFFNAPQGQGEAAAKAALANLQSLLSGQGLSNNPFLAQLAYWTGFQSQPDKLTQFFQNNEDSSGNPIYTPDQYWTVMEGTLANSFATNNNSFGDTIKQMLLDEITYMIGHIKNGYLLIQMIMSTLGENMDMQQQSLGGYGALSKTMSSLSQLEAQINSGFSGQFTNSTDAENFIDNLRELLFDTDSKSSMLGPVVPAAVQQLYNDITGLKDSNGVTIASLLNPPAGQSIDWSHIQAILVANKPSGSTDNPNYDQVIGDLKQTDTSLTGQTQTISTAEGTITSKINTLQSAIKDIMITQWSEGWNNAIVQNQGKANQ